MPLPEQRAQQSELAAFAPDVRLWDRARAWDVIDLMPAIALTMLERWAALDPTLARLDAIAGRGGRLAGAVAAAIREEMTAAQGGPTPAHVELVALGATGIRELLQFRVLSERS